MSKHEPSTTVSRVEATEATEPHTDPPADEPIDLPLRDAARYELLGEHERGGIGRVLRVRDRELGREIAVKELVHRTRASERRFLREARITARLPHPGVVPVYEAGRWPSGEPFYAMKLIEGTTLRDAIETRATLADRIALLPNVISVADTIAYAHSRDIVHRDLKPANVIVGPFGETVVIDWGLAKELERPAGDDDGGPAGDDDGADGAVGADDRTKLGTIVGTPAYMPPEQARGETVGKRADVYAIGAILYHLLAGRPPYAGDRGDDVVAAVLAGTPPALPADVPRDLVAIVDCAMVRDPSRRYADAAAMVDDLRRYAAGRMVSAHTYTAWTLIRRFVRRHRAVVMLAAVATVVTAALAIASVARIAAERDDKERARHDAELRQNDLILAHAAATSTRDPTEALAWLRDYRGPQRDRARVLAEHAAAAGVATHVFRARERIRALAVRWPIVAGGYADGVVRLWNADTGVVRAIAAHRGQVFDLLFVGDDVISGGADGVVIAHAIAGASRELGRLAGDISTVIWLGDRRIAASSSGGDVVVMELAEPARSRHLLRGAGYIEDLERDPATGTLYAARADGSIAVWNGDGTPAPPLVGHAREVGELVLAPGGRRLISASEDGRVVIRDLDRATSTVLVGSTEWIPALAIAPDGRRLVAGTAEGTILVWDLETGIRRVFPVPTRFTYTAIFLADGRIATSHSDGTVRLWDLDSGRASELRGHTTHTWTMVATDDGRHLVTGDDDGSIRVWPIPRRARELVDHDGAIAVLAAAPNGALVASAGVDTTIRVWDTTTWTSRALAGHTARVNALAMTGDGRRLVSGSNDRSIRIWDLATGRDERIDIDGQVWWLVITRDDRYAIAGGTGTAIEIVDLAGGPRRSLRGHAGNVGTYELAPDGVAIATGGVDATIRIWDLATGEATALPGHTGTLFDIGFASGGRLLSCAGDGTARVWNPRDRSSRIIPIAGAIDVDVDVDAERAIFATERELAIYDLERDRADRVLAHVDPISEYHVGPDGVRSTGSFDGSLRVWDRSLRRSRLDIGHAGPVTGIVVLADGRVVSAGEDGVVRVADPLPLLDHDRDLAAWIGQLSTAVFDGEAVSTPVERAAR